MQRQLLAFYKVAKRRDNAPLNSTKSTVEAIESKMEDSFKKLQESNRELKNKLEHLERYSRDFNIRLIGVEEEEGEDCMAILSDHFTLLGWRIRKCSPHRKKTGGQTKAYYCEIVQ